MVYVRRGELACRTDWDHDLWEPRETVERVERSGIDWAGPWRTDQQAESVAEPSFVPPNPPHFPPDWSLDDLSVPAGYTKAPALDGQSGHTEPFPHIPPAATERRSVDELGESDAPFEAAIDDVPPDAQEILAALPRICRTCRDFRPTGDARFGWCANPYAFAERTLVHAESLACASSMGSWWVPTDDWWLQRADISHHGQPTPHVDQFLRELLQQRQERRRRATS